MHPGHWNMSVHPGEMYGHSHFYIEPVKMFALWFIVWLNDALFEARFIEAQAVLVALLRTVFVCKVVTWSSDCILSEMWVLLEIKHLV